MKKSQDIQQFINSLSDTEKQLALSVLTKPQTMAECCFSEAKTNNNRNYIDDSDNSRKHVRAFITAINFPSSLDELYYDYFEEGAYLDIETLLFSRFRENHPTEWTVPKWAKPDDICMFYFAKTADAKIRGVQKEFEARRDDLDWAIERGLEILIQRGWQYCDKYSGTIFAVGKVAGKPYYFEESGSYAHWHSPIYAEISEIFTLENPLSIADFRDVVFLTRGGTITPVFGREFDIVRDRITATNDAPRFFLDCSTKPLPLRGINEHNWMKVAKEYRTSFILEQEFRACYVDYLLQGLSDDGAIFRECRTKKAAKGQKGKAFVDNVILFNGLYLPVEVKLNILAEANLSAQCEKYCHLDQLFLEVNEHPINSTQLYNEKILIVDTDALYLYDNNDKSITTVIKLDTIQDDSLSEVKSTLLQILSK